MDATLGTGTTTGADPVADPVADPLVGVLLNGRYRLEGEIARGGMATVYRGTDLTLDRTVAVKMMRPALAEDPDFVDRFVREARAAAKLSSADVVAVYDQGTDAVSGTAYLVMEHVEGRTLRDVVDAGPLPPREALDLLEPVLRALSAAHEAGLVHRDVKPENVLLGRDGRVKVADFGLARAVESSLAETTGLLLGTVAYLAPEQVEHGRADARTDVYSAGILLYELLTGEPPYRADMAMSTPMSVAFRHVHEDVPPPSRLVEGVPLAVDDLVQTATRRDPSARPVDAGAFLAQLRAVRAHLAPADPDAGPVVRRSTAQPTLVVPRPPTGRRRRSAVAAWSVLGALVLAAVVAGGWWLLDGRYTAAPDVLLQPRADALATLNDEGFSVSFAEQAEFSGDVPEGAVARQDPQPDGRVLEGGRITLVLSAGPRLRAVPPVGGLTEAQAVEQVRQAGLEATVVQDFDAAAAGTVARTEPAAGSQVVKGDPVQVVVSKGLELLPVPDVRGQPADQAAAAVEQAGLAPTLTEVFSEDVDKGAVAGQEPVEGTAPRGSAVELRVSKGPERIVVPDVSGRARADAQAAIEALGLQVEVQAIPGPGKVRSTRPGAGEPVRRGSTVTLYVF